MGSTVEATAPTNVRVSCLLVPSVFLPKGFVLDQVNFYGRGERLQLIVNHGGLQNSHPKESFDSSQQKEMTKVCGSGYPVSLM